MQKKYPFKFLEAYTRQDADIFFGREQEIEQLYEMVFQSDLLLIYGESGTGKTSLIRCGLASKFQLHDWLPLFVRRGQNLNDSLEEALIRIGGEIKENEEADFSWLYENDSDVTKSPSVRSTLSKRLNAIYLNHFKPIYLIFDQFEELYILGTKAEQAQFIAHVKDILKIEQPIKIVLSIREEYLGHLYEFEREVPQLLRKKLRVEPMNLEKVKTVVKKVGSLPQSNVNLQAGQEDQIAAGIFEQIRGKERTLSIQLPYLQVFLDKLYLQVTHDETRQANATFSLAALEQVGDIGNVLRNFLDEQVLKIAKTQRQETDTIWKMLSPFVTLEGTKEPLSESELRERLPEQPTALIQQSLRAFLQGRILRYNEQAAVYEIMHDSLAKQIHAKRSDEEIALLEVQRLVNSQTALNADAREYFSEKQLEFIAPFREQLRLSAAEAQYLKDSEVAVAKAKARAVRQRRIRIALVIAALAVMSVLTIWAIEQQQEAKENLFLANSSKVEAQINFAKANKLINAFYFYADQFALAYGYDDDVRKNNFYFIDEEGNEIHKLKRWEVAEQFDYTGFAKVRKEGIDYLLDTLGSTYQVAYSLSQITDKTIALDLRGEFLNNFPSSILQYPRLQILILDRNNNEEKIALPNRIDQMQQLIYISLRYCSIEKLPAEIGKLHSLVQLNLYANKLSNLPAEIGQLHSLTQLNLSGNNLKKLPFEIKYLQNLSNLDLTGNQLEQLPIEIGQLTSLTQLDLRATQLSDIPPFIKNLQNLKKLDLVANELTKIPRELGELQSLTELYLSHNQVSKLFKEVGQLQMLKKLDLDRNELKELPIEIGQLRNLKQLDLSNNQLKKIPPSIGNLQALNSLNLEDNELSKLPFEIGQLQVLKELHLGRNHLEHLPYTIGNLQELNLLDANSNSLVELNPEIKDLQNLTSLNLYNNKLDKLPPEIGQLRILTNLNLGNNQLEKLPSEIKNFRALRELDLYENKLIELPSEIGQLQDLDKLNLNNNELSELPLEITQLQALTQLYVSGNRLSELKFNIAKLRALKRLSLYDNRLSKFPPEIGQLQYLTTLNLGANQLSELTSEIEQLQTLVYLDLRNNQLSEFPQEIFQLQTLSKLDIGDNQLKELPSKIGQLKSLTLLNLWNNKIRVLPPEISQLTNLKALFLLGNPMTDSTRLNIRRQLPNCKIR